VTERHEPAAPQSTLQPLTRRAKAPQIKVGAPEIQAWRVGRCAGTKIALERKGRLVVDQSASTSTGEVPMRQDSLAQRVAPFFGLLYITIGIVGFFVTGFSNFVQNTGDTLIGFHINPMHNLVHLLIGIFLIVMATRSSVAAAEGAIMGVGLFYIVAFVIGATSKNNLTILSMYGYGDLENFNHLVNGVALLTLGLVSSTQTQYRLRREGLT
jgi:hypothetical protein